MTTFSTESFYNQLLERLAQIQESISLPGLGRITKAYPYAPADAPQANIPFVVNQGMPSRIPHVTPGLYWPESEIDMHFCLANWQGDSRLALANMNTARWIGLIFSTFAAHVRLSPVATPGVPDLDFIIDAFITDWTNTPYKITYGTADFAGFTFRLKVRLYLITPVTA